MKNLDGVKFKLGKRILEREPHMEGCIYTISCEPDSDFCSVSFPAYGGYDAGIAPYFKSMVESNLKNKTWVKIEE